MEGDDYQLAMERRKAEVRARLEAQSASKKKKKGFMTPERKKKLRILIRKHAAQKVFEEQEWKSKERRRIVGERCGKPRPLENLGESELRSICNEYYSRICKTTSAKIDIEKEVEIKDYQINELNIVVNDLRGKFTKPSLKKVSKYENKFAKLQKKAAEFNFRNQLKTVKKKEFTLAEEEPGEHHNKKPDWALDKTKSGHDLALKETVSVCEDDDSD